MKGQYVHWIVQSQPRPETLERLCLKAPSDFIADSFREVVLGSHTAEGIELQETVFFKQPHENGTFHNNLLVRALKQYKWLDVATRLRAEQKLHVNFARCTQRRVTAK